MLKEPIKKTSLLGKLVKGAVAAEIVILGTSYYFYSRINRNQWYRFKIYKKYPKVLDWYYTLGEKFGGLDTRQTDLEYFKLRIRRNEEE